MRPVDGRLEQLLGPGAAVLTAMLDLVPDPVGILWAIRDADGTVTDFETGYGNPAMDRMIGVSMERAFGRRLLGHRPEFSRGRGVRADARRGGDRHALGGRDGPLESSAGPIGSVTGVFLHRALPLGDSAVVSLVTDVTAERRLEADLEGFAKVAAHDLREPLMAMGMFAAELARRLDRGRDETNERLVELLRRTDVRAKALVDGILEYARHGSAVEAAEDVDLGTVAAEVADSLCARRWSAPAEPWRSAPCRPSGGSRPARPPAPEPAREQPQVPLVRAASRLHQRRGGRRVLDRRRPRQRHRHPGGAGRRGLRDVQAGARRRLSRAPASGSPCRRKIVEAHGGAIAAQRADGGGTIMRFSLPATPARVVVPVP